MTFLSAVNFDYITQLYLSYLKNPVNIDEGWRVFFDDLGDSEEVLLNELAGANWTPEKNRRSARGFDNGSSGELFDVSAGITECNSRLKTSSKSSQRELRSAALDSIRAIEIIRSYRTRGHLIANLDPLGLREHKHHPELDPAGYGFSEQDMDRKIFINGALGMEHASMREILDALRRTYCDTIGVEYLHLSDPSEKAWIQGRIENIHNRTDFTLKGKKAILQRLAAAELFERYLHKKYPGTKRFGIDGGEAFIPAVEQIIKRGGQLGINRIAIGMAHRGRLNVLGNILHKPMAKIFAEFSGMDFNPEGVQGSGDVKYHLGASSERDFDGNVVQLSLAANPSHLESVNPVVTGKARARQTLDNDKERRHVLPLLVHGDASFAGQGIAAETLMISELPGYRVGGTIHVVINNQIGFTTMPKYGRSGPYPTDIAKMLAAPIFHVNGDDAEAVVHVARVATEFRQEFGKDVVIDMFCYRRYGHNEGDEPSFTQPVMYRKIAGQKTTLEKYSAQLQEEGVITGSETEEMKREFVSYLDQAFAESKNYTDENEDFLGGDWEGLQPAHGEKRRGHTYIGDEQARRIGRAIVSVPEDFNLHPKLRKFMDVRGRMFEPGQGIDWSTAEALAFGSLADDGFRVRLSGQDSGRGTFSQRHAILYDQENDDKYIPLNNISAEQAEFEVHNSPLSEAAVLGFEYGYSLEDPKSLVIWEAQFGDFANSAQAIIDQYIACGEAKWQRMSGLVLLLPHGHEGQGPEHSSARLERFLQLSGDDNWQVCNCTTPANYFHVLRRQMCRDFRKPLILLTPKSLLRHKLAVSKLSDMTGETFFHRYLSDEDLDELVPPEKMRRLVCCSGKVYYDLLQERRKRRIKDIALMRLEQLYPFPMKGMCEELSQYPGAEIVWCQEEPRNQGAWFYMGQRFEDLLDEIEHYHRRARYIGRPEMAATATGILGRHVEEQNALIDEALR
jgi:2-oxoglutarate dehydrogenase E1 component